MLGPVEILLFGPVPRADFMKPVRAIPAAAALLTLTACTGAASPTPPTTGQMRPSSEPAHSTTGRPDPVNIHLTVDGRVVNATLNDSATAHDFASLLPLTLPLSDFHETERISGLPRRLTTAGAPETADPQAGDLALYAPWGNLAIYYRDAPAADGLVLLGRLADGGAETLATADRVTIEIAR